MQESYESEELLAFYRDFRLGKVIGQGAYAKVMKVTRRADGAPFALKIKDKTPQTACMFEGRLLASLDHLHCVRLEAAFETPNKQLLLMEYLPNDLFSVWERHFQAGGSLSPTAVGTITYRLAEALHYLHAQGIVHRDVKPENILVSEEDETDVKLADLGLARLIRPGQKLRTCCGSPSYVAPEVLTMRGYDCKYSIVQYSIYNTCRTSINANMPRLPCCLTIAKNAPPAVTHCLKMPTCPVCLTIANNPTTRCLSIARVDVWGLGVLVYVLLSNTLPFGAPSVAAKLDKVKKGEYSFPPSVWAGVIDQLDPTEPGPIDFIKRSSGRPSRRLCASDVLQHPWVACHARPLLRRPSQLPPAPAYDPSCFSASPPRTVLRSLSGQLAMGELVLPATLSRSLANQSTHSDDSDSTTLLGQENIDDNGSYSRYSRAQNLIIPLSSQVAERKQAMKIDVTMSSLSKALNGWEFSPEPSPSRQASSASSTLKAQASTPAKFGPAPRKKGKERNGMLDKRPSRLVRWYQEAAACCSHGHQRTILFARARGVDPNWDTNSGSAP
eukprot:g11783.t1